MHNQQHQQAVAAVTTVGNEQIIDGEGNDRATKTLEPPQIIEDAMAVKARRPQLTTEHSDMAETAAAKSRLAEVKDVLKNSKTLKQ